MASINIEYNDSPNPKFDDGVQRSSKGFDLKKEITKFNSKIENLKKINRYEREREIRQLEENIETNFLDMPADHNKYTKGADYVKNKIIVLNLNKDSKDGSSISHGVYNTLKGTASYSSMRSSINPSNTFNKGILYKTHTLRNKFSSSNAALDRILHKSLINESPNNLGKDIEDQILYEVKKTESYFVREKNSYYLNPKDQNQDQDQEHDQAKKNNNNNSFKTKSMVIPKLKDSKNSSANKSVYSETTIYKVLNKRKKDFIDSIIKQPGKTKYFYSGNIMELQTQKQNFLKTNAVTHYMEKKKGDEVPYVFPIALISKNNYNNYSEKNRYEKITEMLLKLRSFIEKDEENEKKYLKEFMMKHGIYDDKYYSIESLTNLMNFLNSKFNINPGKTMKEILIMASSYTVEDDSNKNCNFNPLQTQHVSYNAKKIIQYKMSSQKRVTKSSSSLRGKSLRTIDADDNKYNMNSYLSKHQPILDDRRFKMDLNDPKSIIDGLEEELMRLKNGYVSSKTKVSQNDSILSNRNSVIDYNSNIENKTNSNSPVKGSAANSNSNTNTNTQKNTLVLKPMANTHTGNMNSFKLPKVKVELDLEQMKKKNKLLEYIVLQRSKTKYQLEQDMKKFKISEI